MKESIERLQAFYHSKNKGEWKANQCLFRLVSYSSNGAAKPLTEKKVDLATLVGGRNEQFQLDLGKGFALGIRINIVPACPKRHAELFKQEASLGNVEVQEGGDDAEDSQANAAEEMKQQELLN